MLREGVNLVDRISVPSKRTITDAGQMHVPCKFARTGSQLYSAGQLGLLDEDPNAIITVWRDEKDVFDESSVASFRSAPVTIGHPKDSDGNAIKLTVDNSKDLQVGMLEGMPVRDEDTLGGVLVLTAKDAITALDEGTQELSAGYTCDIELIDDKYYQRNIQANHIAIVPKGRAGNNCRISDEALDIQDEQARLEEIAKTQFLEDAKTIMAGHKLEVVDGFTIDKAFTMLSATLVEKEKLVVDYKAASEEADIQLAKTKLELEDAVAAAKEEVVERVQTMEDARLIADMRNLGSKTTAEIKRMVVEDQMPDKDLKDKGDAYVAAMFEILGDSVKGETPMGKLLKNQDTHVTIDAIPESPAESARKRMIARHTK